MKKIITAAAFVLSAAVFTTSCKSGTSEVGKWKVTDMGMASVTDQKMKDQMAAQVKEQDMMMEFTGDGKCMMTAKSMPATEGKYTRSGNTMTITDNKTGKAEKMEIASLTDSDMKLEGDADGQKMSMSLHKQ